MLLLLMLVAQLDAGVTCPGVTATDLEAWRVEVMDIVDWQRAAYAEHVLAEHHVTCPAFVSAVTPTRIVALDGAVQVSWEPVDGPLCFEAVTVTAGGVTSTVKVDGSPCVSFDDRGAPTSRSRTSTSTGGPTCASGRRSRWRSRGASTWCCCSALSSASSIRRSCRGSMTRNQTRRRRPSRAARSSATRPRSGSGGCGEKACSFA